MKHAWTQTERQAFAVLCELGDASAREIVDTGRTRSKWAGNVRAALRKLTAAGYAVRTMASNGCHEGRWAPMAGKALPEEARVRDDSLQIIRRRKGSIPDTVMRRLSLAGMADELMRRPVRLHPSRMSS